MTPRHDLVDQLGERLGGVAFGGDYNPEQWDEATWLEDAELMRSAGVNLVSVGIFGWAVVEPEPDRYDWSVYDRVLDLLHEHGITVCLATMTASPPPWLARLHPDTLPVDERGTVLHPGSRQHVTPSSEAYRRRAAQLVTAVASRYGQHPALGLWHVNNEYGCHLARSYGEVDAAAFRRWLRCRYGDVDRLNEAWSTTFWSQRYGDWSQVDPPRAAPTLRNPAQLLDFARFSSDALLTCYRLERDILRTITPEVPVATNLMTAWETIDYHAWGDELDVVGHDAYPDPADPDAHADAAMHQDLMRSLGRGRPWMLMEQAPSAVNWRSVNVPKPPGAMRRGSLQAVARGADAVMFFQWRQSRGGAEKFHSAMLPAAGPDTRTHREVVSLGNELPALAEVTGSRLHASVALVLDWSSWWALELDARPSDRLRQLPLLAAYHRVLYDAGIATDVVAADADLSGYRLVLAPNLYLVDDAASVGLHGYVRAGGHVVVGCFSGIVDGNDRLHAGAPPGAFRELLGLHVEEPWPLHDDQRVRLRAVDGERFGAQLWSELIVPHDAEVLATFDDGPLAGHPAITANRYGEGRATYLGTFPDPEALRRLVLRACHDAGVEPVIPTVPPEVEVTCRRHGDGTRYLFLLNHGPRTAEVPLPRPGQDLLTDRAHDDIVTVPAGDVVVLRLAEVPA